MSDAHVDPEYQQYVSDLLRLVTPDVSRLTRAELLIGRSTGVPRAGHLAREARPFDAAPRRQGAHPSPPGVLCVRPHRTT